MKRVLIVVSVLLLALAIVSCGNLAVDKKGDGTGSIVINLGGSARSAEVPLELNGAEHGSVYIRNQDDVTDYQLILSTPEKGMVYIKKVAAASTIVFDDVPSGEYFMSFTAFDGNQPFAYADMWDSSTNTQKKIQVLEGEDTVLSLDMIVNLTISFDNGYEGVQQIAFAKPINLPYLLYSFPTDEELSQIPNWNPDGKEIDYWTDAEGNQLKNDDEIDLDGKKLPIVFTAHWKDATNPPGGDPYPTVWTSVNKNPTSLDITLVTVPSGTVTSPVGNYGGPFKSIVSSDETTYVTVNSFLLANTELTYAKWYEVYSWATSEERGEYRYTFADKGREGGNGQEGDSPVTSDMPVGWVSWRDAIIWCNAASEMAGLKPVYWREGETHFIDNSKVLRESANENVTPAPVDKAVFCRSANGYRLPEEKEWEFAARGGNPDDPSWSYKYAEIADGYSYNFSSYAVFTVDTNPGAQRVGSKTICSLNLYDMCGNMSEWVWDKYSTEEGNYSRIYRCGGFSYSMDSNTVNSRSGSDPTLESGTSASYGQNCRGFRVACNAD